MKSYIDLSDEKLKLLKFTQEEIDERKNIIEEIKKNNKSIFTSFYDYFFGEKENYEEVKIKYS